MQGKGVLFQVMRGGVFGLGLIVCGMVFFEESLIFFPSGYNADEYKYAVTDGPKPEDVFIETPDGETLHAWFLANKDAEKTFLFFHGNAGNLAGRYDWAALLTSLPANVLLLDYRGYGRSTGKPNEKGIYVDARSAYDYLITNKGVKPENIVVYGKSLGGAAACELATEVEIGALILQSTFSSAKEMAKLMFGFLPVHYFVSTKFANNEKIKSIKVPKLIIHSKDDEMIPVSMAEELFSAAPEPKMKKIFKGPGHNDLIWRNAKELLELFSDFLFSEKK